MKKPIGILGIIGCVVCTVSMTLAAIGVAGAAATSAASGMAGMSGGSPPTHEASWLTFLLQYGPEILGISVLFISISFFLKRKIAVIPGMVGGAILYWGMYMQPSVPWMYGSMAIAAIIWMVAYVCYSPRALRANQRRLPSVEQDAN